MSRYLRWGGFALALLVLVLSVTNASWLAPYPISAPKLIAHRALAPQYDRSPIADDAAARDPCRYMRIEQPYHRYIENTQESVLRAQKLGAWFVAVDTVPTKDDEVVLFPDQSLTCRTNGPGMVKDTALERLQSLDIGHGYRVGGAEDSDEDGAEDGGGNPSVSRAIYRRDAHARKRAARAAPARKADGASG
jgi:glycerophosphoryl diester phosphodiesterase